MWWGREEGSGRWDEALMGIGVGEVDGPGRGEGKRERGRVG